MERRARIYLKLTMPNFLMIPSFFHTDICSLQLRMKDMHARTSLQSGPFHSRTHLRNFHRGEGRTFLQLPNGKKEGPVNYELDLTKAQRFRVSTNVPNLPLTDSGRYSWIIQLKTESKAGKTRWSTLATIPFDVKVSNPEGIMIESKKKTSGKPKSKTKSSGHDRKKKVVKSKRHKQ